MADGAGVGSPQLGDGVTDVQVQVQTQAPSTSPGNKFSLAENASDETTRRGQGTAHTMATQLGGGGTPVSAAQAESKQPQSGAERLLKMLHRNIGTLQRNVESSMERLEILHNQLETLQSGAGAADDGSEQRNIESEIEKESDMLSKTRLERIGHRGTSRIAPNSSE